MTNKWYDVKNKLPKSGGKYLVKLNFDKKKCNEKEVVDILCWDPDARMWFDHKTMFIFSSFQVYETIKKLDSEEEALSPVESRPYIYFNDCVVGWKNLPK